MKGISYFALIENLDFVKKKFNLKKGENVIITNVVEITKEEIDKYIEILKS